VRYISTRGQSPEISFDEAALRGLAPDGGLYMPKEWPRFSTDDLISMQGLSYVEVAKRVIRPFVGDSIEISVLDRIIRNAYSKFYHQAICPLTQIESNDWIMEQFHGPTLAFKDVAMCFLAPLLDHLLEVRQSRSTIVVATSGDTGSAAVDAFKGAENIDLYVLLPKGRVSEVQQRQMTTSNASNVHPLLIEGTFDDCQNLVKSMFSHDTFREKIKLSGVNSINWGRIVAQSVYYVYAAIQLGAPHRPVSFCVPTGNFGNIFAAYVARQMGIEIEELIIASNQNDILPRTLETGRHEMNGVQQSQSPSMDIQISSNFERFLFELSGRDAHMISGLMNQLKQSGSFNLPETIWSNLKKEMKADRASEAEMAKRIQSVYDKCGYLLDPHTAVGYDVAIKQRIKKETPLVTLSTAHPAKFPDAVEKASGQIPNLPNFLSDLYEREEAYEILPNALDAVETYILETARSIQG